eukprot:gb/GEZN01007346.1/.p1 GENE.gb/GEZN01007346.1/~~gb/GEZN01007346.1/.p1  ORF type:complete len:507 (-),score=85.04 gb/GEZN01007346.1/:27-1394(-)
MVNRASCYIRLKRLDEALKDCQKALQRHPGYATAYLRMGQIFLAQNRRDDAKQAFASALACDLTNETAKHALNRIHMQTSLFGLQKEAEKRYGTPFKVGEHFTQDKPSPSPWKSPWKRTTPLKSPSKMPFTEEDGPFIMQGFLLKKGSAGLQAWRPRWFELSPYALLWRLDDSFDPDTRERGMIPVMSIHIIEVKSALITLAYGPERSLALDAQTEAKAVQWEEALLKAKELTKVAGSDSQLDHLKKVAAVFMEGKEEPEGEDALDSSGFTIPQTPLTSKLLGSVRKRGSGPTSYLASAHKGTPNKPNSTKSPKSTTKTPKSKTKVKVPTSALKDAISSNDSPGRVATLTPPKGAEHETAGQTPLREHHFETARQTPLKESHFETSPPIKQASGEKENTPTNQEEDAESEAVSRALKFAITSDSGLSPKNHTTSSSSSSSSSSGSNQEWDPFTDE